jgi:hypothetical protein
MRNGEKAGRVAQVFGVQLRNKFLSEQFRFWFLLTTVRFIQIFVVAFLYGVSDIFMYAFKMELNDYPHIDLANDGTLCSRASIARCSRECYTTHSSVLATTRTLRSTIADYPRPTAWTSARLA